MTDYWILILFNLLFTSVPPIIYGVLDKDVSAEILMQLPQLYMMSQKSVVGWRMLGLEQIEIVSVRTISVFLSFVVHIREKRSFKSCSLTRKNLGLCTNVCAEIKAIFSEVFGRLFPAMLSNIWMVREIKDFRWSSVLDKCHYQHVHFIHFLSCQYASWKWASLEHPSLLFKK